MAVFLFFGQDTYSLNKKLSFWRSEFEKKHGGDMNISIINGGDSNAQEIFQCAASVPFLGEKRLLIVKNFLSEGDDRERAALAELLPRIPDSSVAVFSETNEIDRRTVLFKKIQKFGKLVEFTQLTGSKLLGWIEKEVERRNSAIEKDALIYLADIISDDLYRLENEIAKLVSYAAGRKITKKDIDLLIDMQFAASIFRLTDGIGQKNEKVAIVTLHQLIETGEDLHRILYMIMRQFRIIMCVRDLASQGLSRDAMATKLKEHPFVISNTTAQSRNFSMEQLMRAYELLIEIDTKLKSGGIRIFAGDNREFVLALDRLVLKLCS